MKMYVKMKELGPVGGGVHPVAPPPLDPPMSLEKKRLVNEELNMAIHCTVVQLRRS